MTVELLAIVSRNKDTGEILQVVPVKDSRTLATIRYPYYLASKEEIHDAMKRVHSIVWLDTHRHKDSFPMEMFASEFFSIGKVEVKLETKIVEWE